MSRSKKKPICKDKGIGSNIYNRTIRRIQKSKVRDIINLKDIEFYDIPNSKVIVNDYDYYDFIIDYRFISYWKKELTDYWNKNKIKQSRK